MPCVGRLASATENGPGNEAGEQLRRLNNPWRAPDRRLATRASIAVVSS